MVYFGVLSVVTPPVALAAFAAAPIAGARPMETGFEAVRLSIAGFIIPFAFVYRPDILIIEGFTALGLIVAIIGFLLATWMIVTGLAGFEKRQLSRVECVFRLVVAFCILTPPPLGAVVSVYNAAGFGLALVLIGLHHLMRDKVNMDIFT